MRFLASRQSCFKNTPSPVSQESAKEVNLAYKYFYNYQTAFKWLVRNEFQSIIINSKRQLPSVCLVSSFLQFCFVWLYFDVQSCLPLDHSFSCFQPHSASITVGPRKDWRQSKILFDLHYCNELCFTTLRHKQKTVRQATSRM